MGALKLRRQTKAPTISTMQTPRSSYSPPVKQLQPKPGHAFIFGIGCGALFLSFLFSAAVIEQKQMHSRNVWQQVERRRAALGKSFSGDEKQDLERVILDISTTAALDRTIGKIQFVGVAVTSISLALFFLNIRKP